jgi:hypothetical protein
LSAHGLFWSPLFFLSDCTGESTVLLIPYSPVDASPGFYPIIFTGNYPDSQDLFWALRELTFSSVKSLLKIQDTLAPYHAGFVNGKQKKIVSSEPLDQFW